MLRTALLCLPLLCTAYARAAEPAQEQTLLVLDASGSMWGQLEGRSKIEIAREALGQMLTALPAQQQLGLVAYGHRQRGDCADIELLHAPGADREPLRHSAAALNPKGMTPISAAVRFAAEHLKYTEQKATVILISDGEETCKADPCAVGSELEQLGIDFTAHVIGFDLQAGPARDQLQCLAQRTGGRYLDAGSARELGLALQQVAQTTPPPPPAHATLSAAAQVEAATAYAVTWTGPSEPSDWIGFVRADAPPTSYTAGDAGTWSYATQPGLSTLRAPSEPGRYVLRYVRTVDGSVLAEHPVEVTPASAQVRGPAEMMAGDTVRVEARGPYAEDHWIGFAPAGSDAGDYSGGYAPPDPSGRSQLRLVAPAQPGAHELRYVLKGGAAVLARQAVTVVPAQGQLQQFPARTPVGLEFSVEFSGPRNDSGSSWIGLVPQGGSIADYRAYCYLPEAGACRITPGESGSFDLVYVVLNQELDRKPLVVE